MAQIITRLLKKLLLEVKVYAEIAMSPQPDWAAAGIKKRIDYILRIKQSFVKE